MSDLYTLKKDTLVSIGDAIRDKLGNPTYIEQGEPLIEVLEIKDYKPDTEVIYKYNFEGITKYKVVFEVLEYYPGNYVSPVQIGCAYSNGYRESDTINSVSWEKTYSGIIDYISIAIRADSSITSVNLKTVIYGLDENGEQAYEQIIKEYKYTPAEMAEKINGLNTIPESVFTITGDCRYKFFNGEWDWFIEKYGNQITTYDVGDMSQMFQYSTLEEIPFDINCRDQVANQYYDANYMFSGCYSLKSYPKILNLRPDDLQYMFSGARVREIPDDYFDTWHWDAFSGMTSAYGRGSVSGMFQNNYSLRKMPHVFTQDRLNRYTAYPCFDAFNNCYVLDKIRLGVHDLASYTYNRMGSGFSNLTRADSIVFNTNEDGTPIVIGGKWTAQNIDLSGRIGYALGKEAIFGYNSGITADKEVKDDATYQALKNDEDWFTYNVNYSRYNHDSAVETINSLPNTAITGGINTIKFKGVSGANTDGGAINTLTEEEIAVATAKGWTVSLV